MGKRPRQAMPEKGHQPVVHFDLSQNSFVEFKRAEAPLETAQRAQRHRTTSTSSSCSSTEPLTGGTALMGGATAPLYSETHTGILKNKSFNEPTLTEEPVAHAELLATPLPIEEVTMELSTNSGNISSYSLSPSPSQQPSSVAVKKKHRKKKNRGILRWSTNDGDEALRIHNIADKAERRDAIRSYVKQRASSKEEEAALLGAILKKLHELESESSSSIPLPSALRYDSKIDMADVEPAKASAVKTDFLQTPEAMSVSALKTDFYQTSEALSVILYVKGLDSSKCHLAYKDIKEIYLQIPGFIVKIDLLQGDIDPDLTRLHISTMNVQIVFTKTIRSLGPWNLPPVLVTTANAPKEFEAPFKDEREADSDDEQSLTPQYTCDAAPFVPSQDMFAHTCGMINRGLDCYINNVCQCLLSFPEFVNPFMDHSFLSRINLNNPLSISKGQMAIAFARLALRLLSETRPVFPLDMKRLVAKHWALYDPYQQHDTQEFLNFLLDCIHEDLNMASRTPFTIVDEDRSDEELAQTYWQAHVLRNDSLVVDSFFGMYKSQIMCTSCSKVSTKFDPFMSLTLEIPEQPVYHDFIVVRADLSKVEVRIPITVKDTVNDVLIDLALQLKAEGPLVATSFESSRIREVIDKATPHQDLYDRLKSTVVYETRPGIAYVVVNHSVHGETGLVPFGIPFIVSLPTGSPISIDDMKMKILQLLKLARIVKHDPDVEAYVGAELRPTVLENGPTYTMDLIWDSIETKNALYDEEEDFKLSSLSTSEIETNCTLHQCLERHLKLEMIDEWKCSHCGKNSATKKLDLWKLPNILILQLKRFVEHPRYQTWTKLGTKVDYPVEELDLSQFVSSGHALYELVAVSNHMGSTDRGHYTAFAKRGDKWFHFDDESVTEVTDLTSLVVEHGYVLFYSRRKGTSTQ